MFSHIYVVNHMFSHIYVISFAWEMYSILIRKLLLGETKKEKEKGKGKT